MHIATPVREAFAPGQPVVALETTLITHGMAYPDNLEIAHAMEAAIAAEGACPATLGIVAGNVTVGLSPGEIERFATAAPGSVAKCSRRDLPAIIARGVDGALTVAGTMMVAAAAGIRVLATGGIGGVHRGHPFDVSADLLELGRSPVAVVCAGAKSILDLKLTLEVLETQGVPVVGLGTGTLPAFFSADSGLALPASAPTIEAAAAMLATWADLDAGNGMVIAVPVPAADALPTDEAERAIETAVAEADARGISGGKVTPFVLKRVAELTGGRSVAANKALLVNNARTAARLAVAAGFGPPSKLRPD